jgi:hypothetical protein
VTEWLTGLPERENAVRGVSSVWAAEDDDCPGVRVPTLPDVAVAVPDQ